MRREIGNFRSHGSVFSLEGEVLIEEIVEVGEALLLDDERGDGGRVGMIDPFAALGRFVPVFRFAQVLDPPRKRFALGGARVIDRALVVFQENAVVGFRPVEKSVLVFDEAGVFPGELFAGEFEMLSEAVEVHGREIDVAGRTRAAFAAACAFESKPVFEPRFVFRFYFHSNSSLRSGVQPSIHLYD